MNPPSLARIVILDLTPAPRCLCAEPDRPKNLQDDRGEQAAVPACPNPIAKNPILLFSRRMSVVARPDAAAIVGVIPES